MAEGKGGKINWHAPQKNWQSVSSIHLFVLKCPVDIISIGVCQITTEINNRLSLFGTGANFQYTDLSNSYTRMNLSLFITQDLYLRPQTLNNDVTANALLTQILPA
jgi:hypothetical protein